MRAFRCVVLGAFVIFGLSLVPTLATGQLAYTHPCDLLTNPELKPEYLSGGHESFLKRFCTGNVQPSDTFSEADTSPSITETLLIPSNVLVNNRANDVFPHITESETSIDTLDADRDGLAEQVVMAWNGAVGGRHGLGHGFSLDMGATWTDAGLLANPPGHTNCCDPGVAVNSNGTFFVSVLTMNNATGRGQLGLSTLTPPGVATVPTIIPGPISADREDLAVDNTGTPGTDGNIYVCYAELDPAIPNVPIRFVRSIDGGVTWSAPIDLTTPAQSGQACRIEVGRHGAVFATWHRTVGGPNDLAEIHIRRCTPGPTGCAVIGDWSADTLIDTVTRAQNPAAAAACSRPALNGFVRKTFENPTLAINRTTGRVHIAYSFKDNPAAADDSNIRYQARNPDLTVAIPPKQLNIDGTSTDQWRPFLAATTAKSPVLLAVAWYSRRLDPGNLNFDVFKSVSTDDGLTFFPEERVTTVSSSTPPLLPNFDPDLADCYMSDYETMDADHENFYIGWSDNRLITNNTPDPDIRFSKERVPAADLSIAMTDSPDPVGVGGELTYRLRVRNLGPWDVTGVILTNTLPANANFVSASSGCSRSRSTVTCNIGNMKDGETTVRLIRVRPTSPGKIINTVAITANETDPDPANNTVTAVTTVDENTASADNREK
jgi:uncharacterized repeat protein (TIGR01451 family)